MDTFAAGLALWEGHKNGIYSALFKEKSIFNEDLPPEDDITEKIW